MRIKLFLLALLIPATAAGQAANETVAIFPSDRYDIADHARDDEAPARKEATPVKEEAAPLFYAARKTVTVYSAADSMRPYLQLRLQEPVQLLAEDGGWSRIRTSDGALGYVASSTISNVWLRVSKSTRMVYVYRGTELVSKMAAEFGFNPFSDKERRGSVSNPDEWRTPEGTFFVASKNPRSKYYKAFVLNYPTAEDAERGLKEKLITSSEYESIVSAEREFRMPPMHTELGGWIEIHGNGTGQGSNWTQGCVAVRNVHMDQLWDWVEVGTPVLIER